MSGRNLGCQRRQQCCTRHPLQLGRHGGGCAGRCRSCSGGRPKKDHPSRRLRWYGPCLRSDQDQYQSRQSCDREWSGSCLKVYNPPPPCAAYGVECQMNPTSLRRHDSLALYIAAQRTWTVMTYLGQLSLRLWFRIVQRFGQWCSCSCRRDCRVVQYSFHHRHVSEGCRLEETLPAASHRTWPCHDGHYEVPP